MRRPRAGLWAFLAVATVCAAVFVRLGVWQLGRLAETREANRLVEVRMDRAPVDLETVLASADGAAETLPWTRVRAAGSWDFEREIVIRARASHGTPGVHVVTPLVLPSGEAILVLRGWLPAADGLSADLVRARPYEAGAPVEIEGLALGGEAPSPVPARDHRFGDSEHRVLGSLDIEAAAETLPYEVAPAFLLLSPESGVDGGPRPVAEPAPSDGPHLWYAIQWFAFALIAAGGFLAYARSQSRASTERSTA